MKKRGQAAMEFLMTYGWAILAAVIVVGVLWYLLGNPANLAGNQFQVSAPLVAKGMIVDSTGITLNILNGASSAIEITYANATDQSGCVLSPTSINITVGDEGQVPILCTLNPGDRVNSDITFRFRESGSTFEQQATGSISARVP